jgi:hypothetical protein
LQQAIKKYLKVLGFSSITTCFYEEDHMNLLSLLLGSMMTQSSVNNLSGKTGTSQSAIMKLLPLAIPILIKYLTKNAQSQQGALSLLGALTQHKNTNSMELQLADADADDGDKILNHILGGNYGNVMNQLAGQSGMSEDQVSSVLANIAPALLSGVSAANTQQQSAGAGSLGSLMSMFGGAAQPQQAAPAQGMELDGSSLLSLLAALSK